MFGFNCIEAFSVLISADQIPFLHLEPQVTLYHLEERYCFKEKFTIRHFNVVSDDDNRNVDDEEIRTLVLMKGEDEADLINKRSIFFWQLLKNQTQNQNDEYDDQILKAYPSASKIYNGVKQPGKQSLEIDIKDHLPLCLYITRSQFKCVLNIKEPQKLMPHMKEAYDDKSVKTTVKDDFKMKTKRMKSICDETGRRKTMSIIVEGSRLRRFGALTTAFKQLQDHKTGSIKTDEFPPLSVLFTFFNSHPTVLLRWSVENDLEIGGSEGLQCAMMLLNDLSKKTENANLINARPHAENKGFERGAEIQNNTDNGKSYEIHKKCSDEEGAYGKDDYENKNDYYVRNDNTSENNFHDSNKKQAHLDGNSIYEDLSRLKTHDRTNVGNVKLNVCSNIHWQDKWCGFNNDKFLQRHVPQRYATFEKLNEYNWNHLNPGTLDSNFHLENNMPNRECKYENKNVINQEIANASENDCLFNVTSLTEEEELSVEAFDIEHSLHCRLIGVKGMQVKRLMQQFQVVVRFADRKSYNPHQVLVTGKRERVEACKMFLLTLARHAVATQQLQSKPQKSLMLQTIDPNNTYMVKNYLCCNLYNHPFFH